MSLPLTASATTSRIIRGDAQAILQAYLDGGRTLFYRAGAIQAMAGAPGDFRGSNGAIRPFAGSAWDGAHYCQLDWHVALLAIFDGSEVGGPYYTYAEIEARLAQVIVDFFLDGQPLETTRTATMRVLSTEEQFGIVDTYGFNVGQVLAPTDLAVGAHTLAVDVTDPIYGDYQDGITFYVDGPESAACA